MERTRALAKGLGDGLPIGALLAREHLAGAMPPGAHGSTFGGNALASAAACTVLAAIDDGLLEAGRAGRAPRPGLAGLPGVARGARPGAPARAGPRAGRRGDGQRVPRRGLLVLTAGTDVLRFIPPLIVTEAELDEALERSRTRCSG